MLSKSACFCICMTATPIYLLPHTPLVYPTSASFVRRLYCSKKKCRNEKRKPYPGSRKGFSCVSTQKDIGIDPVYVVHRSTFSHTPQQRVYVRYLMSRHLDKLHRHRSMCVTSRTIQSPILHENKFGDSFVSLTHAITYVHRAANTLS